MSLAPIKAKVAALSRIVALDARVLEALTIGGNLLSREWLIWDYKREVGSNAHERCELVKDVVAFHNSYGGYLLLGVEEVDDDTVVMVGILDGSFEEADLRALVKSYTGTSIELSYRELTHTNIPNDRRIGILHIPARLEGEQPVMMERSAAAGPRGKLAFKEGQIILRAGSECRPIAGKDDLTFLLSRRALPANSSASNKERAFSLPLPNTLPAKNLICPQFVGREQILDSLWNWLADPFTHVRVLAGDGGKGKTSIAYAFASEFSLRHPSGYQHVVWLTAKTKQFAALDNEYVDILEYHFSDVESLLRSLATTCAVSDGDLEGASIARLKTLCKDALAVLPALVVIDDIDSLEPNDQKRVMEMANQFGSSRSRFLLTTRTNLTYSTDVCITVHGLELREYQTFIESLCARLKMGKIESGDVRRLHDATDGSPLLTESIIRLVHQGMPISSAIDEWRGHAGQDARNAALEKEISRLSPEARRVLLCMTYLGECSLAEVRQATNYGLVKLGDAIAELQSLFLISAPVLTQSEPRFAVPPLVRFLANEKRRELAADFNKLISDTRALRRSDKTGRRGQVNLVGAAIAQASAQLAQERVNDSVDTLLVALQRYPGQPNLQSMLARCYMKLEVPRLNEARDLFHTAFKAGNRRREVLLGWHEAERMAAHWPGALEVANLALKEGHDDSDWQYRRAYALSQIATTREKSGDAQVLPLYEQAAEALAKSIDGSRGVYKAERIDEARALNDLLWARTYRSGQGRPRDVFETVFRSIKRGDFRSVLYARLLASLRAYLDALHLIQPESSVDLSVRTLLQQADEALRLRPQPDERFQEQFAPKMDALEARYRRLVQGAKGAAGTD